MSGQLWGGRYLAKTMLGRGGMATVWQGHDLRLDRPVAIKVLSAGSAADPNALQRFHREAQTVARLAHPNIVAVHDLGVDGETPYLILELVSGGSLANLLSRGPLPIEQAVRIAVQTCQALSAAHTAGVVHRDIKPANLLLAADGLVKVCDFGIARLQGAAQVGLTAPATAIGTSEYMAPEQAAGGPVDPRTDLYAVGCLLHTMLTGAPPFTGENPLAVLYQHLNQPAPSVRSRRPEVPPALDDLVGRLLAKDPAARPASAIQASELLRAIPLVPHVGPGNPVAAGGPARTSAGGPASTPAGGASTSAGGPAPTLIAPAGYAKAAAPVPVPDTRTRTMPAAADGPPPEPTGRSGRPLLLAGTAAVAVLLLVIGMMVALRGLDRPSDGANAPTADMAQASAPNAPSDPAGSNAPVDSTERTVPSDPSPTPPTPDNPADRFLATLDQQVRIGVLDGDEAKKLRKVLAEVRKQLIRGETGKAARKRTELRRELGRLHDQGQLTWAGYRELSQAVGELTAGLSDHTGDEED